MKKSIEDRLKKVLSEAAVETVKKMVAGSADAARVVVRLLEEDLTQGMICLAQLGDNNIYGKDIWFIYRETCGGDLNTFRELLISHPEELTEEENGSSG